MTILKQTCWPRTILNSFGPGLFVNDGPGLIARINITNTITIIFTTLTIITTITIINIINVINTITIINIITRTHSCIRSCIAVYIVGP